MTARVRVAHYLVITSIVLSLSAGFLFCLQNFLELNAPYTEPSKYEIYSGVVSEITKRRKGGYLLTIKTPAREIRFTMLCGFNSITLGESISIGSVDRANGLTLRPPRAAILIKDDRELCRAKFVDYQGWKASKSQRAFIFYLSLAIFIISFCIAIFFIEKPVSEKNP